MSSGLGRDPLYATDDAEMVSMARRPVKILIISWPLRGDGGERPIVEIVNRK
jgi:hypothetical protein